MFYQKSHSRILHISLDMKRYRGIKGCDKGLIPAMGSARYARNVVLSTYRSMCKDHTDQVLVQTQIHKRQYLYAINQSVNKFTALIQGGIKKQHPLEYIPYLHRVHTQDTNPCPRL